MPGYHRILLATDFAADNRPVVDKAAETAKLYDAELWIIHVLERVPVVINDPSGGVADQLASLQADLDASANAEMATLCDELGVPADRTHAVHGRAATEIHHFAEANAIDLIVMGTHGQHGLGLLLGSTANAVLHGIACDSLIVRVGDAA